MTNRELYLLVADFNSKRYKGEIPSLENYLKSLWAMASPFSQTEPTIVDLANWLDLAFTHPTPEFDSIVYGEKFDLNLTGFESWENRILFQIADLHQMAEYGHLKDEMRHFGISLGGSPWYNFDVLGYLDCAVSGMYSGMYDRVEGTFSDIYEITDFSWKKFEEFLHIGQIYE